MASLCSPFREQSQAIKRKCCQWCCSGCQEHPSCGYQSLQVPVPRPAIGCLVLPSWGSSNNDWINWQGHVFVYHLPQTQTVTNFPWSCWRPDHLHENHGQRQGLRYWLTPTIEENQKSKMLYWSIGWCKGQELRREKNDFYCQRIWFVSEEGIQHPFLWDFFFHNVTRTHFPGDWQH